LKSTQKNLKLLVFLLAGCFGLYSSGLADSPLIITNQPQSRSVLAGTAGGFIVSVEGGPISYQWRWNGTNLVGATNGILSYPYITMEQAGNYSVVVSNSLGAVTSSNALLSVTPLVTDISPKFTSVNAGSTLYLFSISKGTIPTNYQWRFNDVDLPGMTNTPLTLSNIQFSQAGSYSVRVGNRYTNLESDYAVVEVTPMTITSQPEDRSSFPGGTVTFAATLAGAPPFACQWRLNGTNLPGATNQSLVLNNLQYAQSGAYSLTASNQYGGLVSSNANLNVGRVAAWGDNSHQQLVVASGLSNGILQICAGTDQGLALKSDHTLVGWGSDAWGKSEPPTDLNDAIAIAAGAVYGMALKSNGTLVLFGDNGYVQDDFPSNLTDVVAIASGEIHVLALKSDGSLTMWGDNWWGQLDAPPEATNLVAIAAGYSHSLALRADGKVFAWGDKVFWGDFASAQANVPAGLTNVVAIAAKAFNSVALTADGRLFVWGNPNPSLSSIDQYHFPTSLTNVDSISMGVNHVAILHSDGSLELAGDDTSGQLDIPTGFTSASAIACGNDFTMALASDTPPVTHAFATNLMTGTSGFSLSLPTQCGRVYRLEYVTQAGATNWIGLPLVAGNGELRTLTDPTATNSSPRFYRVCRW
jgi:hypothetical protein